MDLNDAIEQAYKNGYKEGMKKFAERLRAKHCERLGYNGGTYRMTGNDIDNLLKEMEVESK